MKRAIIASLDELGFKTKKGLLKVIKQVMNGSIPMLRYDDKKENVSYIVSYDKQAKFLVVSSGDVGPVPNASALEFLTSKFGEPTFTNAKPSSLSPGTMIFYMGWDFKQKEVEKENRKWLIKV